MTPKTKSTKSTKAPCVKKTPQQLKRKAARRAQAEVAKKINEMDFLALEILPLLIDQGYANPAQEAWKIATAHVTLREIAEKAAKAAVLPRPVLKLVPKVTT